jgi:hypothetical protein
MARRIDNPYDWQGHNPQKNVQRKALLTRILDKISGGGSGFLLGARGTGKSVFLGQLEQELQRSTETLIYRSPPLNDLQSTIDSLAEWMADKATEQGHPETIRSELNALAGKRKLPEMFDKHVEQVGWTAFIFDELEQYRLTPDIARLFFGTMETIRKKHSNLIVLFAAGSFDSLSLVSHVGSPFFTRAYTFTMSPFSLEELTELAEPFKDNGRPLDEETLSTLLILSGGNAQLATYGLQQLWDVDVPRAPDVSRAFQTCPPRLIESIQVQIYQSKISNAPLYVWLAIARNGSISQEELNTIKLQQGSKIEGLTMDKGLILDVLCSSGIVGLDSRPEDDPVLAHIVPGVLSQGLPRSTRSEYSTLREQLCHDLADVLGQMHAMGLAFFNKDDKIMHETAFAAQIALGLLSHDWMTDLEPLSVAGYVDIKVRHQRFSNQHAVIEVKIWPRNDYKEIEEQARDYWSYGAAAAATVMILTLTTSDWREKYAKVCLPDKGTHHKWEPLSDSPLEGYYRATDPEDRSKPVDHFLLRIRKRV